MIPRITQRAGVQLGEIPSIGIRTMSLVANRIVAIQPSRSSRNAAAPALRIPLAEPPFEDLVGARHRLPHQQGNQSVADDEVSNRVRGDLCQQHRAIGEPPHPARRGTTAC